jgi:hypothetical protein
MTITIRLRLRPGVTNSAISPPVIWQLKMSRSDKNTFRKDEVGDVLLALGYEWGGMIADSTSGLLTNTEAC